MRQAEDHFETPSLADVVHRAVEACDPTGTSDAAADFAERFEDRDEPVTAVANVEVALREAGVDPEDEDPVAVMITAVATYLAHRRTELDDDRERLLRLAARAALWGDASGTTPRADGHPPEHVARWLAGEGVEL